MLQVTYIIVGVHDVVLIVLIVGTILGIYFYKREEPMHVSSWIKRYFSYCSSTIDSGFYKSF